MNTARMEAFSDGVIAIIITIMVLELKVPHGADLAALRPLIHPFMGYVLSFLYVGIYWNNHHHMLQTTEQVSGAILWANLNLLFWLSMFPIVTEWVGENPFSPVPAAFYGVVLTLAALSYVLLQHLIVRMQGPNSLLKRAVGQDWKGNLSPLLYISGILIAWVSPLASQALYFGVALIWLIPDRRIERLLLNEPESSRQPDVP